MSPAHEKWMKYLEDVEAQQVFPSAAIESAKKLWGIVLSELASVPTPSACVSLGDDQSLALSWNFRLITIAADITPQGLVDWWVYAPGDQSSYREGDGATPEEAAAELLPYLRLHLT